MHAQMIGKGDFPACKREYRRENCPQAVNYPEMEISFGEVTWTNAEAIASQYKITEMAEMKKNPSKSN